MNEKIKAYPKTELFEVVDTMGVPHPFCITHHHVVWASDHYCGRLDEAGIAAYEKKLGRGSCGVRSCNLTFAEHEQALVVKCKVKDEDELRQYLLSIKDQCEKDGFSGFVLVDGTGGEDG